jgi:hypothetical protein
VLGATREKPTRIFISGSRREDLVSWKQIEMRAGHYSIRNIGHARAFKIWVGV